MLKRTLEQSSTFHGQGHHPACETKCGLLPPCLSPLYYKFDFVLAISPAGIDTFGGQVNGQCTTTDLTFFIE
jgi:hypothetical protein